MTGQDSNIGLNRHWAASRHSTSGFASDRRSRSPNRTVFRRSEFCGRPLGRKGAGALLLGGRANERRHPLMVQAMNHRSTQSQTLARSMLAFAIGHMAAFGGEPDLSQTCPDGNGLSRHHPLALPLVVTNRACPRVRCEPLDSGTHAVRRWRLSMRFAHVSKYQDAL
jgi:hypothetical protein